MSYGMLNLLTSSPMKRMTSLPSRDTTDYDFSDQAPVSVEATDLETDDFVGLDALDAAASDKYGARGDKGSDAKKTSSLSNSRTRYRTLSLSTNNLLSSGDTEGDKRLTLEANNTPGAGERSDRDGGVFGSFDDIDSPGGTRGRNRERSLVSHDHDTFRPSPLSGDVEDDANDTNMLTTNEPGVSVTGTSTKDGTAKSEGKDSLSLESLGGVMPSSPKIRRSSSRGPKNRDGETLDNDATSGTSSDKEGVQRASGRPNFLDVKTAEVVDYQYFAW
ncbi:hypothetical protein SARC_02894 [Sphaeroforma arctica JP610]|uniref:Uncharacterized protein n=1 Tax=Sphaeroforma arctica JP610 TaxID=667725 RepID=A0A0L0G791_9EUKA|nr:hypothetical protein SARC_02894 [Sphaeroforma arctica JP610]KNC84912.1 hypothetical protein SARC_02894 [Sphaeroforma arctica JP610]|eukprot:XP_014158814.1 hypothetical protein SARC_02894 [Sphaeroforma arctica JP610]